MNNVKVCVLGLGYIGLPTAALLANSGFEVNGCDVSPKVVDTINEGKVHIVEPGLEHSVNSAVRLGNLHASLKPQLSDIYMICVPTPIDLSNAEAPRPDVSYIESAVDNVAALLKAGDIVILESTSPVGSTAMISERLAGKGVDTDAIYFACCPERVIPGHVMRELVENDRIVGGLTTEATTKASAFYRTFVKGDVLETNAHTAEMAKLAENSYRDVNIAYANELSMLCERQGIDVRELISLTNKHPRVNVLSPGPGVGGHCIAVDPWFLVALDPERSQLIRSSREVNKYKESWVIEQVEAKCREVEKAGAKATIACLGLAFKPDIDDLRESPSLGIVHRLVAKGFEVVCVEPNIEEHNELKLVSLNEALQQSVVVGLVRHSAFVTEQDAIKQTNFIDFCGIVS